jgi:hypothetical protein
MLGLTEPSGQVEVKPRRRERKYAKPDSLDCHTLRQAPGQVCRKPYLGHCTEQERTGRFKGKPMSCSHRAKLMRV